MKPIQQSAPKARTKRNGAPLHMSSLVAALNHCPNDIHFESQEKGEEIVFLLRRHWLTNLWWMLLVVTLAVLPFFSGMFFSLLGLENLLEIPVRYHLTVVLLWYLVCLAIGLVRFLDWYFNVYIVTDRRIVDIDFSGLLFKNISECSHDRVQDVTYRTGGLAQTIFDFGDVYIQTAAEQREFEFRSVPRPGYIHDKVTDLAAAATK